MHWGFFIRRRLERAGEKSALGVRVWMGTPQGSRQPWLCAKQDFLIRVSVCPWGLPNTGYYFEGALGL